MLINLILLFIVSFVQNMAFTWASRSRNSGDPNYHRWASLCSNGVWFVCQLFLVNTIWAPLMAGNLLYVVLGGIVYTVATSEGSVTMMKYLLKKENGKRKVGA